MKKILTILFLAITFNACESKIEDPTDPKVEVPSVTSIFNGFAPTNAKIGEIITISGTNFSTVAAENEVAFKTVNSTVNGIIKTASPTSLTVEVPPTAITGAITLKVKGNLAVLATGFIANFTIVPTSTDTDPSGNLSTYTTKYFLPDHIATDDQGNVYTTGILTGKQLQKFDSKGELITAYIATDFGFAATEQPYIVGVSNDRAGNVWVLMVIANKPCRLYKITSAGQPVLDRTIDNTKSSLKTISVPDMEVSSTGEVYYVVETHSSLVKKIDNAGVETTFISNTTNPFNLTNTSANLTDLSFDGADNLYISMNNSTFTYFGIYKYTGGVQTKLYGSTVRSPESVVNGTFSTGSFRNLQSLVASSDGKTLYAGDGNYLRKITLADDKITTIAGTGQQSTIAYTYNGSALSGKTLPAKLTFSTDQKSIIINSYGVLEKLTL